MASCFPMEDALSGPLLPLPQNGQATDSTESSAPISQHQLETIYSSIEDVPRDLFVKLTSSPRRLPSPPLVRGKDESGPSPDAPSVIVIDNNSLPLPPEPFEYGSYDPNLGKSVSDAYWLSCFTQRMRANKYGADIARTTKPGWTPSPVRAEYGAEQERLRFLDELSTPDTEYDNENDEVNEEADQGGPSACGSGHAEGKNTASVHGNANLKAKEVDGNQKQGASIIGPAIERGASAAVNLLPSPTPSPDSPIGLNYSGFARRKKRKEPVGESQCDIGFAGQKRNRIEDQKVRWKRRRHLFDTGHAGDCRQLHVPSPPQEERPDGDAASYVSSRVPEMELPQRKRKSTFESESEAEVEEDKAPDRELRRNRQRRYASGVIGAGQS